MEKKECIDSTLEQDAPKSKVYGFVRITFFIQVIILLNIVFYYFGLPKVYVAAIVLGYVYLLTKISHRSLSDRHLLKLAYFFSVLLTGGLQMIIYPEYDSQQLFYGLLIYTLFPGFWFLMSLCVDDSQFFLKTLFWKLRFVVAAASVLGIIQYFFAPTLFGLLDGSMSHLFSWAESSSSFVEYSIFFRATSLWGSPQICGLYLSLFIIGLYTFSSDSFPSLLTFIPCFLCGALSFNKSFYLNMLLFFFFKYKMSLAWKVLLAVIGILAFSFFTIEDANMTAYGRVFSIDRIVTEEFVIGERIEIYGNILKECGPWGNGIGTIQNTTLNESKMVAESFLLQILYEMGILPFVLFLLIFFEQFRSCPKEMKLFLFAAFLSMLYVHAFNSIYMMLFYSLFFLDFPPRRELEKSVYRLDSTVPA